MSSKHAVVMRLFRDQALTIGKCGTDVLIQCDRAEDAGAVFEWLGEICNEPIGVVVTLCEKNDSDYCLTLRRPDGSTLKVLIPIEGTSCFENECVSESKSPFGLNLVTDGHYI